MADQTVKVRLSETGAEEIAFRLLVGVASAEGHSLAGTAANSGVKPNRKWILDTYAECLTAARGYRHSE